MMKSKSFALLIAGVIFGIVGLLHLARLLTKIPIMIGEFPLPLWINVVGFWVTAFLSVWLIRLSFSAKS